MDLSVVVVSWNVRDLLESCLRSICASLEASPVTWELLVVDNASSDGSPQMVRERFPKVRSLANATNLGYAGGCNQGLQASSGRLAVVLNPDTVIRGAALETMMLFMAATPQAGMVGPRLVFPDGAFQHSAFAFPGLLQVAFDLFPIPSRIRESRLNGRYPRTSYASGEAFEVGHPLGACVMVCREAFEAVGGMDTGFFMYCEELDWAMRFHRAGWQVYCLPTAELVHYAGQSTRQVRSDMFVQLWRSRFRFYRKHYGPVHNWIVPWIVRAGMGYEERKAVKELDARQLPPEEVAERREAYRRVRELAKPKQVGRPPPSGGDPSSLSPLDPCPRAREGKKDSTGEH